MAGENPHAALHAEHLLRAEWHTHVAGLLLVHGKLGLLGATAPPLPEMLVGHTLMAPARPQTAPVPAAPTAPKPKSKPAGKPPGKPTGRLPKEGSNLRAVYDALDHIPRTVGELRVALPAVDKQVSPGLVSLHGRGLVSRHVGYATGRRRISWTVPGGNDTEEAKPTPVKGGQGEFKRTPPVEAVPGRHMQPLLTRTGSSAG
jgi:hypothetical protein